MLCENCKKKSATRHVTELSHQKVKKVVHLCEECIRETTLGRLRIQCENCKKKSAIMHQVKIGYPNAEPKIIYFCEECIKKVKDRLQCEKCKKKLDIPKAVTQYIQDFRSKTSRWTMIKVVHCCECSRDSRDSGTFNLTLDTDLE